MLDRMTRSAGRHLFQFAGHWHAPSHGSSLSLSNESDSASGYARLFRGRRTETVTRRRSKCFSRCIGEEGEWCEFKVTISLITKRSGHLSKRLHEKQTAKANTEMRRTAVTHCSYEAVGFFGCWIRSQSPFPAAVGDLDHSATGERQGMSTSRTGAVAHDARSG